MEASLAEARLDGVEFEPGPWRLVLEQVASILRGRGHSVFTPTHTGLGERSHLLSKSIDLDLFITDVVNVLKWGESRRGRPRRPQFRRQHHLRSR
jgi:hypothetical protein